MKWEGEFPPAPPANKRWDELYREKARIDSEMQMRIWAAPIYWLEALPRARWWKWLRAKILKLETYLCGDGNRSRLD